MSGKATNNLSTERIHQLLAAIGDGPGEDATPKEAAEYNWREPRSFNSPQLAKLNNCAKKIATAVAEKFSSFCRSKCEVTIGSITMHFASDFSQTALEGECKDYYLPFGADQEQPCGFIGIPRETAVVWAKRLLGDSDSEKESNVTLSQLEESLLLDLTSALVEVFSVLHAKADFHPAKQFLKDEWPLKVHDTEALCRISFNLKKTGSEECTSVYFLIVCEELNAVVGKTREASVTFSAEEISRAALNHLLGVPVLITAQLASTELTFEEVATLQKDDILLLDKKVNQPVDLIIDGQTVYYGWPVQSAGKYAVTIGSTAFEKTS